MAHIAGFTTGGFYWNAHGPSPNTRSLPSLGGVSGLAPASSATRPVNARGQATRASHSRERTRQLQELKGERARVRTPDWRAAEAQERLQRTPAAPRRAEVRVPGERQSQADAGGRQRAAAIAQRRRRRHELQAENRPLSEGARPPSRHLTAVQLAQRQVAAVSPIKGSPSLLMPLAAAQPLPLDGRDGEGGGSANGGADADAERRALQLEAAADAEVAAAVAGADADDGGGPRSPEREWAAAQMASGPQDRSGPSAGLVQQLRPYQGEAGAAGAAGADSSARTASAGSVPVSRADVATSRSRQVLPAGAGPGAGAGLLLTRAGRVEAAQKVRKGRRNIAPLLGDAGRPKSAGGLAASMIVLRRQLDHQAGLWREQDASADAAWRQQQQSSVRPMASEWREAAASPAANAGSPQSHSPSPPSRRGGGFPGIEVPPRAILSYEIDVVDWGFGDSYRPSGEAVTPKRAAPSRAESAPPPHSISGAAAAADRTVATAPRREWQPTTVQRAASCGLLVPPALDRRANRGTARSSTASSETFRAAAGCYNAKQYERAAAGFAAAMIAAHGKPTSCLISRGRCYEKMGKVGKAKADFQRAHELDPTDRRATDALHRISDL